MESLSLEAFKKHVDVALGFSDRLGSAGLMSGLNHLEGLFQHKQFYISVILMTLE